MSASSENVMDDLLEAILNGRDMSDTVVNLKDVNLSHHDLTTLPEKFFGSHFRELEQVNISCNKLKFLPAKFTMDPILTSLDVSHNQLSILPAWLGTLIRLKELILSWNPLDESSVANLNELGKKCRRLRLIEAKNCRFETLPKIFCQNKDLLKMDFGNCNEFLPEHDRNVIYNVPSHIVGLVGIVELNIANAFVTRLPENFGQLQNLERLDLHNNQISWLPSSFVHLIKLERLDLSENQLDSLPLNFETLPSLKKLYLAHNHLTWFPENSHLLEELLILDLYSNRCSSVFCKMNFALRVRIPLKIACRKSHFSTLASKQIALTPISSVCPTNLVTLPKEPRVTFFAPHLSQQRRTFSKTTSGADIDYETASDETLESLGEYFEELFDSDSRMLNADVSLASGVLNVTIPNHGTYVINKQSPNKQIWLSSPQSGPARFDLIPGKGWVYKRTGENLHQLLNREIGQKIFGLENPGFENCYLGSGLSTN